MKEAVQELFHQVADLSREARERYFTQRNIDTSTREEVEALLAFDSDVDAPIDHFIGEVAAMALPQFEAKRLQCGAYRLGDLLGRGGMGAVYLAERVDGEVSQRVAVKLLRFDSADLRERQRFLSERQILANLSHPNIARLLDAGHRDDGQPYLVMEYIEGKPIDLYTNHLTVRQKIVLFIKVCAAISYLHRNLVVHRDLKPANILITGEGEPKLLDFGIAKMIHSPGEITETAMPLLTPDYASPEQVRGVAVTTATDVYSLGAVLYKVLTSASPHQFKSNSVEEIAAVISSGSITPPSKLAPALSGDVEMIVLKALRAEPQERYSTVEQFSEDLDNYLHSRPVRARKGDAWYRTRKLVRRHWLPIAAALAVVASLVGGVLVANHHRVLAERRFVQVRSLANKLFDIDAEVRKTPGTVKARELIVSTSLDYLRRLAAETGGDPELALEVGTGYMKISRLQGVPTQANLGHTEEAISSSQIAEQYIASVLASQPGNRTAMLRMGQIAADRMNIALRGGEDAKSLSFARQSERWLQKFDAAGPMAEADADILASTYLNVCNQLATASQVDEAIALCNRGMQLTAAYGTPFRMGTALVSLAQAYRTEGRLEEALQAAREAAPMLEHALDVAEGVRNRVVAGVLIRQGAILGERDFLSLGRSEEALPPLERAYSIADDLAARDPNDSDSRDRLFIAAIIMTQILRDRDPQRELVVCDHTISRLRELPNSEIARREEARMLAESSYALRSLSRSAEARQRLDRAVELLREVKLYPVVQLQMETADMLSALAENDAATGKLPHAVELYESLLQLRRAAGEKPESVLSDAVEFSRLCARLASLEDDLHRANAAMDYRSKRLDLWKHWEARVPNNSYVHRQLVEASKP
jgi:tRNA A-37 threonylcarbamoyl transferase component Bud32/tetratricopeptide (TPR) repeat protein